MDFFKMIRVYSAVTNLVEMVKTAQADGKLSPQEIYSIVFAGLAPVLDLFGVKLAPPEISPELLALSQAARDKDAMLAQLLRGVL